MKKLLALLLSALLSLTAVGALAEEAPLNFLFMTISSDTWNSEQLPMVELQAAHQHANRFHYSSAGWLCHQFANHVGHGRYPGCNSGAR